ncbi:diguanylate cyclase [Kineosporia rhizophila]|uniref:diguanylate cyclase domain-containing protein n=1 Tax=Kineosporia rhizophila TaxID=84633 RepID=UPI001E2AEE1B|nr:diguanylate cyclase [Kineosporia rhizophila]MCE0539999.1 diguanylate cyclase [Kineosporia rhizophila]
MTMGGAAAEPTPRDTPAASADARPAMPRQFTPTEPSAASATASAAESARLAELHSLGILDTPSEPGFDDLVTLAAQVTGCPIALVSLIDEHRQWFKARVGVDLCETGRDVAFCDFVVRGRTELEVGDLRRDPRFADNPFVTGPPHAVFYAGYPIGTPGGAVLGTICVIDLVERNLTLTQREQMRALARQVSSQLELRRLTVEQAREIERRTAAQRRLARSRSEYRLLTENSGDVIARFALDGRITYISPSAASVLGAGTALEAGVNLLARVHPDDRPHLREAAEGVREGESTTCTVRVLAGDENWRWLECALAPLYDPDRGELEIHCAARDVTERVDAAGRIARSEERLRSIFQGSPMGITLTDTDGRIISANPAMCRLLGVPQEELIGRLRSEFVHPADAALHPGAMRELMERPGESMEVLVRYQRYDGVLAWASAWLSWIHDGDPEPHLMAHVFDVTDRRRAETALADSEANLAAINVVTRRILSGEDARGAIVTALVDIAGANLASLLERGPGADTVITGSSDPRLVGTSFHPDAVPATAAVWREEEALFIERAEEHPLINQDLVHAMGVKSILYQPVKSGDEMIALLSVSWDQVLTDLTDRRLAAVALLADEAAFALEHDALLRRYEDLAGTDQLTGLPNRRSWDERLSVLIAAARRRGEPFVVALADVDRFKNYNDAHGHLEGDVLLREVAQAVKAELRVVDVVARWGGEEFAIALPNCRDADARQVLERVRQAMPRGQSISIGYCEWDPARSTPSATDLMNRADAALYEAKRTGRDRVVSAG